MESFPSLIDHLVVIFFGWAMPLLSSLQGRKAIRVVVFSEPVRKRFYLSNSLTLSAFAGIVLLTWQWQQRPWEAMGFRGFLPAQPQIVVPLTLLLLFLFGIDLWRGWRHTMRGAAERSDLLRKTPFLPRQPRELPYYILMCASAGIFEEVIYRGFMVTYFLPDLNGREGWPFLAMGVPALLFSLAHYYQGWASMGKILLLSVLLAMIFIWGGSLGWVMALHFAIDFATGLSMMRIARLADEERRRAQREQASALQA